MGILDFFSKEQAQKRQLEKLRKTLINMWVQSPERNYAAEQLRTIGTDEAIMTMMERFKHTTQNTTYDNEEKIFVYDLLVDLGPSGINIIKHFVRQENEKINWPMKALDDLLSREQMAGFIEELLSEMDVDYERSPEKKEQLLIRSRDFADMENLQKQIARFVVDDNEGIRFIAADATAKLETDWAIQALRDNLKLEDSGRVQNIVCEIFVTKEWCAMDDISDDYERQTISDMLPKTIYLNEEGLLQHK